MATEETVVVTSSEAHLDLLLAEELSVNPSFVRRFIKPIWVIGDDDDLSTRVRLNVWDEGGEGCALVDAGENDLDVVVTSGERRRRLLIEDKVWAEFQPDQCNRYRRRAESRGDATFLVAPKSRLDGAAHGHCNHVPYPIEDLAGWLADQAEAGGPDSDRLRWKATVLRRLCTPTRLTSKPDHPPTVAFTRFCASWLAGREPRAKPNLGSLRTAGNGWLWFSEPSGLVYKAAHGFVDLYVAEQGFRGTAADLIALVSEGEGPAGFVAATDTVGNPILRYAHPASVAYSRDGVPADVSGVEAALRACAVATAWLAESRAPLDMPSTSS